MSCNSDGKFCSMNNVFTDSRLWDGSSLTIGILYIILCLVLLGGEGYVIRVLDHYLELQNALHDGSTYENADRWSTTSLIDT